MCLNEFEFSSHLCHHARGNPSLWVSQFLGHCQIREYRQSVPLERGSSGCRHLLFCRTHQQRIQFFQGGVQFLPLEVTQHLVKHQMVNVQARICGDVHRNIGVPGFLVQLVELLGLGGRDYKAVLAQKVTLGFSGGQDSVFVAGHVEVFVISQLAQVYRKGVIGGCTQRSTI